MSSLRSKTSPGESLIKLVKAEELIPVRKVVEAVSSVEGKSLRDASNLVASWVVLRGVDIFKQSGQFGHAFDELSEAMLINYLNEECSDGDTHLSIRIADLMMLIGNSLPDSMKLEKISTNENAATTSDRAHVSNSLAILNQAAAKFWANADRDDRATHPKKNDVVAWLIKHGFSQITAESGSTIIRPEWAPTGRIAQQ